MIALKVIGWASRRVKSADCRLTDNRGSPGLHHPQRGLGQQARLRDGGQHPLSHRSRLSTTTRANQRQQYDKITPKNKKALEKQGLCLAFGCLPQESFPRLKVLQDCL
ncbi:hypothetical protein [Cupriavidus sp. D39]|uniref:hypothetical protein n=1 Tax=Cupriavidus sp. D39 TaxID=2997877 RepID=UPI002270510A|nr:hypothetical protein [Cupriavidus sp. D39]MCY0852741.1 hypothetical protein [Cupriavidus sp. D39]